MATRIKHKRSSVAGKKPIVSQLESGELAINTADGKVYLLRDDNTVQDITRRVFEGDSEVAVSDLADSASADITMKVNGNEKIAITDSQINLKDNVDIEDAGTLTFRELTASGDDGVSIKAPDTLDAGYNLTLPPSQGTIGQLLATDGSGNLFFQDADIFGGNVIYVSAEQGNDANDGQSAPVKTLKRACQIASGLVYNADGTVNFRRVNIKVAVGDYTEDNPVIVPDNTVIKGDGLRGCIIRPANANQDMLRVRNACYFGEFTFRDGVDENQVPLIAFDYAVAFDDPDDVTVSRVGYTNLPTTKPTITTSPYVQNASIISFLGGNGAKIDGSKVESPNVPVYGIEAENPVVGAIPEQGKSMVANAFTILSFGGTAWRLLNDAYAQIVSCFEIFLLNGVYCQSGGYCSITNSATNFGLYALRSSGYSPKAFQFDRAFVTSTGVSEGKQTVSIVGINREAPVEEFVLRFREPDYKTAHDLLQLNKDLIADDVVAWIDTQIAGAAPSIWAGFTYNEDKCKRDIQLLVDSIRYDIIFNSNYRSVSSALRYFSGSFSTFASQKDQHIAIFAVAKTYTAQYLTDGTAISRANALWDEIIDIITNGDENTVPGDAVAAAYSYPTPTGGTDNASDSGFANAVTQLENNKDFIIAEITAWINVQIADETSPFAGNFTYSASACERDTGLIIDALIYDLTYGGNLQTYNAALAYFVDGVAQYGSGQLEETVAAYTRLQTVIEQVIVEDDVVVSTGNLQTQDKTASAGSTDAKDYASARLDDIINYLNSVGATLPTKINPDISWVSATLQSEFAALDEIAQINLSQRVTQYINEQIQANIWYNFTYDSAKCYRDTQLIVEAVAKDTWDTGNRYSRSAGLSYYTRNLQDSSAISISGQELQTIAAINKAKTEALTYITNVSLDAQDFVGSRFDIINTIINDPNDLPDPLEVSSEGDITNDYKTNPTETEFNAATDVNPTVNVFTIVGHGFSNAQKVIYDPNGNTPIQGLDAEQTYYVNLISEDEFTLTFDESLEFPVNIISASTGTHKFLSGIIEFYVEEILTNHQTYQTLILESGAESYEFVPGRAITGTTGASNNSAIVYSWEPRERRLVVSVEEVSVGQSLLRIQFDETSVITSDHADTPNNNITINEVSTRLGLGTATFSITATDGSSSLTNLANLLEKQVWFHRPSIVNSSAHTWEYAGSGTDYNALPQNGGNTRAEFEQFEELPGRVYSSGTNELGDFKVGDFITAFNRTGNITFRNKVQVDELDALRLSLSDVAIEEISTDVNLGDDEIGGPSNNRLSTQLAVRSFIANRLGGFVDKSVSTAAVPGAIVQLNVNGQLNPDLIPATRQFTNTNTNGYLSRLLQVDDIPATDLKAGDIATENYEQVELTLSGNISALDGDTITQPGVTGAIGYAKGTYVNSSNILVATIGGAWDDTDDSTGDPWEVSAGNIYINGQDSGENISSKGVSSEIIDNFFLRSSNTSQYLVLDPDDSYTFTSATVTNVARSSNIATITTSGAHNLNTGNSVQVLVDSDETYNENTLVLSTPSSTTFTIANEGADEGTKGVSGATARTIVTSADGNAQGAVTEVRYGVLTNVDNANITGGSLYTPTNGTQTYNSVPLTANTGVGTGATANITVTAGQVTDVDVNGGGTGYAVGDLLSCNASSIGGTGSGFEIEVVAVEKRAYVNIIGGELFVASSTSVDFVEDNTAVQNSRTINLDDILEHNFLAGVLGSGGAVDYTLYRISITDHGYGDGDPVTYNTNGNTPIGGLLNGDVYYTKRIDEDTIELYEDFSLLNKLEFLSTPANNNHTLTRYTINLTDNSVILVNHGYNTGDAIRIESLEDGSSVNVLPSIDGEAIVSGSRFFIGSVTDNSFTLHSLRSDALSSINGLVTNAKDIGTTGVGSAEIIKNNVQVNAVVNTSSRIKANWNTLAVTNIDAENIISGTISPSRLASAGIANTDTFLRGDSSYQTVVQSLKKSNTTDNPIVLTGSSLGGEFYGDPVNIGIANADYDPLGTFSTLGVSRFLQTQFDVNTDGSGEVFIKDGVVDAGTLDGLDSAYFLNPANLTSVVPVSRGGTAIGSYAIGDIIYAETSGTLNTLNIGRRNNFLKSNGTTPEWGTALDLAEGLDVGSAKLTSSSTGNGQVYNENVTSLDIGGAAENVSIGKSSDSRALTTVVESYEATSSQSVVVNLTDLTQDTSEATANGEKEIVMSDTTGILAGMLVTGSASIPSNTTVSGVTDEFVYLSNDTTGTILTGTTLTFTYTPFTLGVKVGDTINIDSSGITNLDGNWPVTGATANATSFTVQTDANVTANPALPIAGTISIDNSIILRNKNVILGSTGGSATPTDVTVRGENGVGTDVGGGEITIQGGLGTGNATGGDVVISTGAVSTTSDIQHTATERVRVDTSGKATFTGEIAANGGTISTNQTTANLLDTTATTINFGGAATLVDIGATSGTTSVNNNLDVDLDLNVDGGDITTNQTTFNLINTNATTLNIGGAATTVNIGTGGDGGGTTTIGHDLVVTGDLTVNGNTTTINSTTLTVDDLNIVVASGAATPAAANGAGLTIDGAGVTLTYDSTTDRMDLNEDLNLTSGNAYFINDASVLNSTTLGSGVVNSSLQTVGTIGTGTWQGTIISPTYGGTGINNGTKTITLGGNFTHTGAHTLGITTTGNTSVTFPTSGTLARTQSGLNQFASTTSAQLAGVISDETGSGSLVFGTSPTFTTGINAASTTMALFNTTATTINLGQAATSIVMGATSGTTRVRNNLDVDGDINVDGGDLTFSDTTINIANTNATTVNFAKAATTLDIGATTGTTSINNSLDVDGDVNIDGGDLTTNATTFNLLNNNATTVNFAGGASAVNIGAATSTVTFGDDISVTGTATLGAIDVDAIDDTPIGSVTPNTGAFTTLTSNGLTTFTNNTTSTSTSTGAVVITGGLGVGGAVNANSFTGNIDASNLTSGTVPDARIAASSITQHQGSITGTGALNSGSITSGFGNINIGTSTFTGNGSGLTTLNASNLSSGTVAGARLGGNQTMAGVKTFSDTSSATSTVTGAVRVSGGMGVAGALYAGSLNTTDGSGIEAINASNLSSGTVPSARISGTYSTLTGTGQLNAGSINTGFGNINIGTSTFTGNGSGLTTLNADNLSSGTVPDARIAASSITQHQGSITGTGALNSGSITSGFGNINIGTSTFTGNGSGLTTLNASNLSSGTVAGARLGGNQTMAGVKTFSDTSDASSTTSGAVRVSGGMGVAKKLYALSFHGDGASLTNLNASNLSSGTIADGRLPTSQAGKTFTSDITVNGQRVGRGSGNESTNTYQGVGGANMAGSQNTGMGYQVFNAALTGANNTAFGSSALASITSSAGNVAIGKSALAQISSTGGNNTAIGKDAMTNTTGGTGNTAVGHNALGITTGDNNTAIGISSGNTLTSGSNNIFIGNNVQPATVTASNKTFIGNSSQDTVTFGGVGLSVTSTSLNFGGTYSGNGSGLTTLNASQLTSGTVPDARIAASSIVQHQASITGTGALNSGSITSGFGNINIGTSTFTGNGSGLTTLNASNLSSGTVAGARLGGNQTMAGIKTFSDTSAATNTTTGAVRVSGGMGVAGSLYAGTLNTVNGSGIQQLSASNLSSGTVPNARISGTYSNLTGTGALGAGSITSGFGNINIGTSTFTGNGSGLTNVDAATLDGIDSTSFLRSDANDTATGQLTFQRDGEVFKIVAPTATNSPYFGFYQGATRRAYIQFVNGGTLRLASDQYASRLDIGNGTNGLTYTDGTTWTVWHTGNDGSGSGLDADTVDGIQGASFLRSDANDSFTGTLSGTGSINISGNITGGVFTGNGSGLTNVTATNANTLDGLDSSQFLRSDANDTMTATLSFGSQTRQMINLWSTNYGIGVQSSTTYFRSDSRFSWHRGGSHNDAQNNPGTGGTVAMTLDSSSNLLVTGEVTAFSDARIKDNIEVIADPLTKILSIRGVTFTRTDQEDTERRHMGVIAQEIEQYFPEVVHTNDNGIKTVNYGAMAGAFIEAFKEQQSQIDELRAMVQKLLDK